jgi:pyruvate formate lyase activating enzyme
MDEGNQQTLRGTILEIQRMSTEDGPGIRTTVFFKGCSLQCLWCHNPESISPKPQLHWIGTRCIDCKTCLEMCPEKALSFSAEGNHIDRSLCTGCGLCAQECPAAALELLGRHWTVGDLTAEILKDRAYFEKSGGGTTLGGGEPTLQATFCRDLLQRLKASSIHTALDTCGMCSQRSLAELLPYTDLLLYDIKEIDSQKHCHFTGSPNEKILENLNYVQRCMQSEGYPQELWIRTPVIPAATDTEENIHGIGRLIAARLNGLVSRWELCAFNHLCRDKYLRLDLDWGYKDSEPLSQSLMEKMAATAKHSGVDPNIVHWSGSTKLEEIRSTMDAA